MDGSDLPKLDSGTSRVPLLQSQCTSDTDCPGQKISLGHFYDSFYDMFRSYVLYKVVLSFSWYQTLMKSRQTIKYIKSFFFGLYSVLYYVICNISLGLVCIWFHVFVSNCNLEIKIIHQSEMQESKFKMKSLKLNIAFYW